MVKSRRRRCGHVATKEEGRNAFKILTRKRPLGRPRRMWEDNIRKDHKIIGISTRSCADSAQVRDYGESL